MSSNSVGCCYLSESRRVVDPRDRVLKTDLNNEVIGTPIQGGIVGNIPGMVDAIEYDAEILSKARDLFPDLDLRQGDIRDLPYENDRYDVVLDLSTLDHIAPEDIERVISEYARVLKPNGCLLLFVWTGNVYNRRHWKPTNQYYFPRETLELILSKHFDIDLSENVYARGNGVLVEYECRKK